MYPKKCSEVARLSRARTMYQRNQTAPATSLLAPKTKLLLAVLALLCGGLTVLPIASIGVPLLAIGVPAFALLLRDKADPLYLLLLPLGYGLGVAVLDFSQLLLPIETLSVFLGGLALGIGLRKHAHRTTLVLLVAAGLSLPFATVYGVQFVQANGFPDIAMLKGLVSETRAELVQVLLEAVNAVMETIPEADQALYQSLFNEASVTETVNMVLICLPAVIVDGVLILSYLITALYVNAVRLCHVETLLPDAPYMLTMSAPSAILYVVAFLLTTVISLGGAVSAVAINLLLLLLPGFVWLAGKRFLWRRQNGLLGRWGRTAFFMVIVLLLVNPFGALLLMGLMGAYEEIERMFRKWKKK